MNDLSVITTRQKFLYLYIKTEYLFIAIILLLLTWYLHGSAYHGYWRLHDGMHLLFALTHSPLQYFLDPVTVATQSTHLTPWNVLFYDINISLFGLNPRWHYVHLVLLIWGGGFLTFVLLRNQLGSLVSLFAAVFFLSGLSTAESAQQLMTGHYLTGLIFTQLSIYLYILSINKNSIWLAISGALFYLMATSCKEIYIPLVIVLPFLPVKPLKERLIFFVPYAIAAIIYIAWRFIMVPSLIGGYTPHLEGLAIADIVSQLLHIPMIIFGSQWYSYIALAGIVYLLIKAIIDNKILLLPVLVGATALLSPLVPLTLYPGLDSGNNRFFYFLWWGLSVLLAFLLSENKKDKKRYVMLFIAFILTLAVNVHSFSYKNKYLNNFNHYNEQLYHFVLGEQSGFLLIEGKLVNYWKRVLYAMVKANEIFFEDSPSSVKLVDAYELFELKRHKPDINVFQYNLETNSVVNINKTLPAKLNRVRKRFVKDIHLSIALHYNDKSLKWLFSPYTDGSYKIFYIDNKGKYRVLNATHQGAVNFSATNRVNFYLSYISPEGWIAQSPLLSYDPASSNTFSWEGPSIIP